MTEETNGPSNVIPENELERRRMVLSAMEELSDSLHDMGDRIRELRELGVPANEWLPIVARHAPPAFQIIEERFGHYLYGMIDGFLDARAAGAKGPLEGVVAAIAGSAQRSMDQRPSPFSINLTPEEVAAAEQAAGVDASYYELGHVKMRKLIDRLFAEAPRLGGDQAPALECQIMLRAGGAIGGALSVTPEGTLRMLSPTQLKKAHGVELAMIEHFFNYEEISDIAVIRKVETSSAETSRIVTG